MKLFPRNTHKVPFFSNGDMVFCPPNFAVSQMVAVFALEWKSYPLLQEMVVFDSKEKG